jgi:hypothetical protein
MGNTAFSVMTASLPVLTDAQCLLINAQQAKLLWLRLELGSNNA